ncbi:MAG: NAD(P)/FAD-dependent oxidoreductase, partial [Elsteraceae bacterium]
MAAGFDRTSIAGKEFPLAGQSQLVVIGAGSAGVAAAIEAARLGLSVTLVDEHPVASGLIGLDVPYMVGERMTAAIQNQARMVEQIAASRPDIADAFEAGVDVQMGISAWAAFVEGPTSRALPGRMLALADESRSWLIGFERMIVAAGARDLALAFPGWDRPGVMGAQGFGAAVTLYDAFAGRRIVVLGGGAAALQVVRQAKAAGIEVAAVISAAPTVDADLIATGVEILAGSAIRGVLGAMEVEGVTVAPLAGGSERSFACDSIVSAIDVAPTVEMFDLLNCATVFDRARGGYVPVIDAEQRCTLPGVYAAGDCAGVSDAGLLDPALARAEGIRAARTAARDAGLAAPEDKAESRAIGPARDSWRREWLSAHAGP